MKKTILVGLAAISVLALSACGTGAATSPSTSPGAKAPLAKVSVGVIAIVDTAPIYLGKAKGFFSDQGLDLNMQTASGGAATVPGVVSGSFNFGFSNLVSLMVAKEKGLDLKVVANGDSTTGDAQKDFGGIVVPNDSPIKSAADLAGKKIAVNNLANIADTTIRNDVDKAGGDSSTIKFSEVQFPDAAAALANKQVDAAWLVEPFLSSALANGNRVATYNLVAMDPKLDIAGYFTTGAYIKQNPEIVKKFQTAMNKSLTYAQDHPDEVRTTLLSYTKIPAAATAKVTLPAFRAEFSQQAAKELGAAAVKYGTLTKAPDLKALLP